MSFIEANVRPQTSYPHIPASPLPITPYPCLAAHPSYDVQSHAIAATIHDYHYSEDRSFATTNNVCTSNNSSSAALAAHEIWLAHSGPLLAHATSAGPYMSDVTFMLPTIDHLIALHCEFHGTHNEATDSIRLPILFVRPSQGVTFVSHHWLHASRDTTRGQRWTFALS